MKTRPMDHQLAALLRMEGKRNFALLMEQGTGKSWVGLADTERCFIGNKIDALLIVAPNGVHSNWVRREIPTHLEVPTVSYVWRGKPTTKREIADFGKLYTNHYPVGKAPLRVLSINVEAINTKAGYEAAEEFLRSFRVMMIVDESTRIKNPATKRTDKVIKLGRLAEARRILTGTPLTKAPTDLYSQFDFLKSGLLGTKSYRAFTAEYAVLLDPRSPKMAGMIRKNPKAAYAQVVEEDEEGNKMWRNLDKLSDLIAPHSYRVRKADCLDLPPKIYQQVTFEMCAEQRKAYDLLKEDNHYVHDAEDMSFQAIAARTKMKQVTSGFINIRGEAVLLPSHNNPRMDAFKEIVEDLEGSFIVWAMYEEEILQIMAVLDESGISAVSYYGETKKTDRETAIDDFQAGKVRAFVANPAAGGIGITLTKAETTIYYSCSYDNELRLQSEDRNHRIGTIKSPLYIDLIAEDSIDEDVLKSLMAKTALADHIIDRKPLVSSS
jgi:SNF2 family DNA or RNA helicase